MTEPRTTERRRRLSLDSATAELQKKPSFRRRMSSILNKFNKFRKNSKQPETTAWFDEAAAESSATEEHSSAVENEAEAVPKAALGRKKRFSRITRVLSELRNNRK